VQGAPAGYPVIEVGSHKGGSAKLISEALRHAGRSDRFYVCDTFAGHARTLAGFDDYHIAKDKFKDSSAEDVRAYLDNPQIEIVVGDIVETSGRLSAERYGFAHIDTDVYPPTDHCLRMFFPKLAPGAVIVIDDYGVTTCPGVKKAVDEFVAATPGARMFYFLTGQALVFRSL
jgi:O-methyltransferase